MSYDAAILAGIAAGVVSQSLWNRAVSYDAAKGIEKAALTVSIPLEQGSVLRQMMNRSLAIRKKSQSLWNRAVSYDCSGVIKPCATRLTEATSQLFPRLRELGLGLVKC